jgi:hypothetical protein
VLLPDGTSTLVMLAETMCNDGVILGVKVQGSKISAVLAGKFLLTGFM